MEYKVCYMSPLMPLVIFFYKTEQDYYKHKPSEIYVIAPRRHHKEALQKARILEKKFKEAKIKILVEHRDKEKIDKLFDLCLKANKALSPSLW